MSRRPSRYFSRRLRLLYPVSDQATAEELIAVCRDRGWDVEWEARLVGAGYAGGMWEADIFLRVGAGAEEVAEELFHTWVAENAYWGINYEPPEWEPEDEESEARRFREEVCGE